MNQTDKDLIEVCKAGLLPWSYYLEERVRSKVQRRAKNVDFIREIKSEEKKGSIIKIWRF